MPDLLIELFSEEIPARMQARASDELRQRMTEGLVEAGLTYAGAAAFATPRRLALTVQGLPAESPAVREERKGPRVDAPEKAIEGFMRGAGVKREDLEIRDEKKGQVYFATIARPGRPAADIVAEVLGGLIRNFPWPKSMRWGDGDLRWVRPLHSILCILTDDAGEATVVPLELGALQAGDTTQGHRFMGGKRFSVTSFDDYQAKLKRGHVILNAEDRAGHIWQEAANLAFASGLELVEDKALLAENAGMVEWPVVLMGEIGEDFLDLPPEVLQTSMKEHQKFFSVSNPGTGRIERFITVANIETADGGATILAGNQKVLAARLADAKFFWENDLRVAKDGMAGWLERLGSVTFERRLGTQGDRIGRIAGLAREIAPQVGADPALAEQAAHVAKADLSSEMVYEFPELQGVMGRYYSKAAGMPDAVSRACEEHYSPLGPSDGVPTESVSVAVALADKLDTLAGFWAIGQKPTGSKDPFALRRAALGVIRLILENGIGIRLDRFIDSQIVRVKGQLSDAITEDEVRELVEEIADRGVFGAAFRALKKKQEEHDISPGSDFADLGETVPDLSDDLLAFLHDRLKVHMRDQGLRHDVIDACIAMENNDNLALVVKRAQALDTVLGTEDGENLVQGFKRANNILTQAEQKDGVEYSFGADPKFAETPEEKGLFSSLETAEKEIARALQQEDFVRAMEAMAGLRHPIDAFFDAVQINTDNEVFRRNRLNMLNKIREICLRAADLTRLEG